MRGRLLGLLILAVAAACSGDKGAADDSAAGGTGGSDGSGDGSDGGAADGPWAGHALLESGRFYNIAHRGGATHWPEHTLVAFEGSAAAGADVLEIDLHATSDGVVVVMHDDTVDRTTDGTGAIKGMTLAELRALDAAHQFTQDDGATYPHRGTGVVVPTFEEVLAAHPGALFNVEIKQQDPPIVDATLAVIDAAGVQDQIVLGSFYDAITWEVRDAAPEILTTMGTQEGLEIFQLAEQYEDTYDAPTALFAAPVEYVGLVMTTELIDKAHRVGVNIHAWTVNDRDEMNRVLDMGVDGIITDDPVTMAEVMTERGL